MSHVSVMLRVECRCGHSMAFANDNDSWILGVHRQAMDAGWRFNSKMDQAWCPKCGPKERPYLYADSRSPPRRVRRIRPEDRKAPKKVPRKLGVRRS